LRTGITVSIIALGIAALIMIMTAIGAMNQSLTESFSTMGANSFKIRYKQVQFRMGGNKRNQSASKLKERKGNLERPITAEQAETFKENFSFPGTNISVTLRGPGSVLVSGNGRKTNPTVNVWGGDENYLLLNGYTLTVGRNLNSLDIETGRSVCILGYDVAAKLFKETPEKCIDKMVRVDNLPYRVIGLLKSRGSSAFLAADNIVITSVNNVRRLRNSALSYTLGVHVGDMKTLDAAIGEATGSFRSIRNLEVTDDDNFFVDKSDGLVEMFLGVLSSIALAVKVIGFITLLGAGIGLANIMLVAVNERTKEIGLAKAIGARASDIKNQFLFESLLLSLMGAFAGIFFGLIFGNLIALFFETSFLVPWLWVVVGIGLCTGVGLLAGIFPAIKAAKMDPIVALRYE
jgi:putative ABC transport system permease protein